MAENSNKANIIAKTLFIAGGIILFIVLVIFIFRLVPTAISGIGSGFKGAFAKNDISITTDSTIVESQKPFPLTFEYTPKQEGAFYINYECTDDLVFDIQSQDGPKRIICNKPLRLGTGLNAVSLMPLFSAENSTTKSTVTILYKDSNEKTLAQGSIDLKVQSTGFASTNSATSSDNTKNPYSVGGTLSGSTVTANPLPTTTSNTSRPTTGTYVAPTKDLRVTYISPIDSPSAFVVHVYNYGNTATGPWEFAYTDAENPSRTVLSPIQASLGAGQGMAITIRFDGQDNSSQTIAVTLDPLNKISESNESNNTSSVVIRGGSNPSNDSDDSYDSNDDADLIITSMEVGRLSGNRFVEDDEIDEDDTAAVRFIVKNQGGEPTGSWRFEINNLPYDGNDSYRSSSQRSLQPGQSLEIVADFDNIDEGRYSIRIEVDSEDDVDEEKENNNTESETLEVNR